MRLPLKKYHAHAQPAQLNLQKSNSLWKIDQTFRDQNGRLEIRCEVVQAKTMQVPYQNIQAHDILS